jgi:hypothetical protein
MFDISAKRLAWIDVEFAGFVSTDGEPGKPTTHKIGLQIDLIDRDEFLQLFVEPDAEAEPEKHKAFAALTEMDRFKRVVTDWRGVASNGVAVSFEDEHIGKLLKVPNFGDGFNLSYLLAWKGREKERSGNSAGSAASGPGSAAEPA